MKPLLLVLALLAALVPGGASAAKWVMRPAESTIKLKATFLGSPVGAEFHKFSADIAFDPADLAHSAVTARIDTGSFDSQNDDRDEMVKEEDWFAVARFPEARFVTKSIKLASPGHYEAIADLTIRGVTNTVTLPFTLTIAGDVARVDGALSLLRTDYGVGQGEWTSTKQVGGAIEVAVHVVADRAP
jgi:polyisoprenoid-binding protein YceI